ncbi:interphotoreceptor matrix proteoglycan 1 isoform X2 [Pygocentrus nattereri]|uniref:Interphotoreceptor matrix proteoglycan 1 n=1 Tax=Pygocentrus nattereri TaxID=42514 RepID=A0AAR2KMZ1_PYGNA|nr:interphotoreceptor matrix proteoglycan 1 isoform X2 [Pygocentrus nattereri]
MPLKTGLFLSLFLFTLQATRIKDLRSDDLSGIRNVKYRHFLEAARPDRQLPAARIALDQNRHRAKRSTLLSTGVKVCPQESMAEVISSHKAYYKLRVCQEAVWEAFQIFLDRVPDTVEYQQWVYACQRDSMCVDDLARNFSSTQEHLDMVARQVSAQEELEGALATSTPGEKCSKTTEELPVMETEKTGAIGTVPAELVEHIIEFSVTVEDPGYSELLTEPDTLPYQDVTHSLHEQMLHIFSKLPGFKEIRLLGFRSGGDALRYAVVFETEVDSTGKESSETTGESGTETSLKDMVAKALSEDMSLPLDIHSLSFEPELPTEHTRYLPGGIITKPTVAISEESFQSTSISTGDAASNRTQEKRGEEAIANTTKEIFKQMPPTTTLPTITEQFPPGSTKSTQLEEPEEKNLITEGIQITGGLKRNTTLDYPSKTSEVQEDLRNEIAVTAGSPRLSFFEVVTASTYVQSSVDLVTVSEGSQTLSVMPSFTFTEVPREHVVRGDAVGPVDIHSEAPSSETSESDSPIDYPEVPSVSKPTEVESVEFPSLPSTTEKPRKPPPTVTPTAVSPVVTSSVPSAIPDENILYEEGQPLQTHSPHQPESIPDNDMNMQEDVEQTEEETETGENQDYGGGFEPEHPQSSASSLDMAASQAKDLVVFFSLRVTNMVFSEDLFNKSSPEYKSLENTFLELRQFPESNNLPNPEASSKQTEREQRTLASIPLLPYLQSNLTGFKELQILNFRNGSVVVNSKMKLVKPVPYNVTEAVHCVLEDFCNAASKRLDIEIDTQSVDVAAADDGDPCKYMDCNEFSRCVVNTLTAEAECLCDPGYSIVDGLPCESICSIQPDYCLNGGQCEIIPGHGATCRCPVGKFWHYHGERCNELVSVAVDPLLFVACLVGSLTMVCAVIGILIFINKKCIRTRKTVTLVHSHSSFPFEGTMRVNPGFENDEGILTHVSSISYPISTDSGSSQFSDQGTFRSVENIHLSFEIPRQLYTRRSEKLVPEMVDFHHCIPHHETWRLSNEHRTSCCFLRGPDSEGFEVTVL